MIGVSYLARYYYTLVGFRHPALWVSTITRLDPLAWGAILAVLYPRIKAWVARRRNIAYSWVSLAIFILCVGGTALTLRRWVWSGDVWWKIGIADILVALGICSVLNSSILASILGMPLIAWLGKISYGLYVYHKFFVGGVPSEMIRSYCLRITGGNPNLAAWGLGLLLNTLLLVAVSAASYYFFEKWFLKWKERFETILSRPA
jgi:peptidoglycan/LPS O-acetylase OafA/YrhL